MYLEGFRGEGVARRFVCDGRQKRRLPWRRRGGEEHQGRRGEDQDLGARRRKWECSGAYAYV